MLVYRKQSFGVGKATHIFRIKRVSARKKDLNNNNVIFYV